MFLVAFSNVATLALAMGMYVRRMDLDFSMPFLFAAIVVGGAIQGVCGFKILHGCPRWVDGIMSLFYFYLLLSASTILSDPHLGLYFVALACPLLGIYCLNSRRYQEMLNAAEVIRLERVVGPHPKPIALRLLTTAEGRLHSESEEAELFSDRSIAVMMVVCWVLSIFCVGVIVVKLSLIYSGVVDGVVMAGNRYGPPRSYSLVDEPWDYGFSMFMHVLSIGFCALFLRLMLLLRR
jgi:hypothetical protein